MYRVCILLSALAGSLVRAQIPSLGWCPDYLPMADFDMDRFLGKWYEAERYFQFSELASRCVVTDYARAPSGKIYVSNEVTNRLTGIKRIIDGTLDLAGKAGEGKLHLKYSTSPLSTESTLTVLDTDYDTYAVVWSCNGLGPLHAENAWVMTRERIPPGPVLQQAYGVLDKHKISRTFFVRTDQAGCAIAASDINAANGIASVSTIVEAFGEDQRREPAGATKDVNGASSPVPTIQQNVLNASNPVDVNTGVSVPLEQDKEPVGLTQQKKDEVENSTKIVKSTSEEKPQTQKEVLENSHKQQPEISAIESNADEKLGTDTNQELKSVEKVKSSPELSDGKKVIQAESNNQPKTVAEVILASTEKMTNLNNLLIIRNSN